MTESFEFDVCDRHCKLKLYTGDDQVVDIPSGTSGKPVTCLSKNAFQEKTMEVVYIPASVSEIESCCFHSCKTLRKIIFEEPQEAKENLDIKFAEDAFQRCNISEIWVPDGMADIFRKQLTKKDESGFIKGINRNAIFKEMAAGKELERIQKECDQEKLSSLVKYRMIDINEENTSGKRVLLLHFSTFIVQPREFTLLVQEGPPNFKVTIEGRMKESEWKIIECESPIHLDTVNGYMSYLISGPKDVEFCDTFRVTYTNLEPDRADLFDMYGEIRCPIMDDRGKFLKIWAMKILHCPAGSLALTECGKLYYYSEAEKSFNIKKDCVIDMQELHGMVYIRTRDGKFKCFRKNGKWTSLTEKHRSELELPQDWSINGPLFEKWVVISRTVDGKQERYIVQAKISSSGVFMSLFSKDKTMHMYRKVSKKSE